MQYRVGFSLLVGADGSESSVRGAMRRAKVRGFEVERPVQELEEWKSFTGLPLVSRHCLQPRPAHLFPSSAQTVVSEVFQK